MAGAFDDDRLHLIGAVGRRLVDAGKIPCSVVQLSHRGTVVYQDHYGLADVERSRPVTPETIFRFYSMTKPITSIALMQLYEEGELLLEDPLERFFPEFADVQVFVSGTDLAYNGRGTARPITVQDLLTHTAGFTYGFLRQHPLDARYRAQGMGEFALPDYDLTEFMRRLAREPLLFDPGTGWNYGVSTDVCGAVIEAVTGRTLDEVFRERIFEPLGMHETGFHVDAAHVDRFAALYMPAPGGGMTLIDDPTTSPALSRPAYLSGGGGLMSTLADYQRFLDCLLAGGTRDGVRLIGRKTLDYMTTNHLPGGQTLNEMGQSLFSEVTMAGMGFGLGFSVMVDPTANATVSSAGEYAWGGAASTAFFVDPVEELTGMFLTQLLPSSTYPIRRLLRAAVYQALR